MSEQVDMLLRKRIYKALDEGLKSDAFYDLSEPKSMLRGLLRGLNLQLRVKGASSVSADIIAPDGRIIAKVPRLLEPDSVDDFVDAVVKAARSSPVSVQNTEKVVSNVVAREVAKQAKKKQTAAAAAAEPAPKTAAKAPPKTAAKTAGKAVPESAAVEAGKAAVKKKTIMAQAGRSGSVDELLKSMTAVKKGRAAKAAKSAAGQQFGVPVGSGQPAQPGDQRWFAQILRAARRQTKSALPPSTVVAMSRAGTKAPAAAVAPASALEYVGQLFDEGAAQAAGGNRRWVNVNVIGSTPMGAAGAAGAGAGGAGQPSAAYGALPPPPAAPPPGAAAGGFGGKKGGNFIKRMLRNPATRSLANGFFAYLIIDQLLNAAQSGAGAKLKMEALDMLRRASNPALSTYTELMMPFIDQRAAMAQQALMRQLAAGEEIIR